MSKKVKKLELMLQTSDNPYDPFTQFDEWYHFDCEKGYYSYSYLARVAEVNDRMTPQQKDEAYDKAMKEMVAINPALYSIVSREVETNEFDLKYDF